MSADFFEYALRNNLLGLDVEYGNSLGFFSGIRDKKSFYKILAKNGAIDFDAEISNASLRIHDEVAIKKTCVSRKTRFTALKNAALFDAVSRFVVVDETASRSAKINNREVHHCESNIYYQYPAGNVQVPIGRDKWLHFTGTAAGVPEGVFEHVFYVRDEFKNNNGNRWIVHHRAVATPLAERLIIRGCNPRFEGPLPEWLNSSVPGWLKQGLFRIRERRWPNFPIMALGENTLRAGHCIELNTQVTLHE